MNAGWKPIQYTITRKDGKTVLKNSKAAYGTMPVYGPDPVKQGYVFISWYPKVQKVTGNATYNAVFYKPSEQSGDSEDVSAENRSAAFSAYWYRDIDGAWRIKDRTGEDVKNTWLCDDAEPENGRNVWYLIGADGKMVTAGSGNCLYTGAF